MATIILRTVGNALLGPIGGAVGSLLGAQIDNRVLAGKGREGPRLDDLAIQGASYGAPIPAIFGTMRVAGTLVWATELEESESVSGAKGQPTTTTYSYSANFAVALSSRPGLRIERIWADGKLLRGAAGDLKVGGSVRFLDGSEDQSVDPLIASHEGDAPAYRGTVLVIFERLELAEYGNRIPLLTFELVADEEATVGEIFETVGNGAIAMDDMRSVDGYAVYGKSRRAALQPLADLFDLRFRSGASGLSQMPDTAARILQESELGCATGRAIEPAVERWSAPNSELPRSVTIDHHDPARDYQVGRASSLSGGGQQAVSVEAPMVLSASDARRAAEAWIARRFAGRDKVRLRLPLRHIDLRPGDKIEVGALAGSWVINDVAVEDMAVILSLSRTAPPPGSLPADAGRSLAAPDIVLTSTQIALFDPPDLGGGAAASLMLAAANASEGWRAVPVELDIGGLETTQASAGRESILGFAEDVLPASPATLLDRQGSVVVALSDPLQQLLSVSDADLFGGANLAMLGNEVLAFSDAVSLGGGRYRLSRLLRGLRGSEWASHTHAAGEAFALLDPERLARVAIPQEKIGTMVTATPAGRADSDAIATQRIASAEALRPPSPCHLSTKTLPNGDLEIDWLRRSRLGFAWTQGEVPLGEASIQFDVAIALGGARMDFPNVTAPFTIAAADLALLGSGDASVSVVMKGDRAASRPASITVEI